MTMPTISRLALGALLGLAACAPERPMATPAPPPARTAVPAGLDRVIGKDVRTLQTLFGAPDQDQREPGARRLQFAGPACVLDAYLYPPAEGREPVVRHVDARSPAGEDFDRASCVAALSRRREAR